MQQRGERNTEADGGGMGYSTPVWRRVNREPIWVVRLRRALETIGLPPRANTAPHFLFFQFFLEVVWTPTNRIALSGNPVSP